MGLPARRVDISSSVCTALGVWEVKQWDLTLTETTDRNFRILRRLRQQLHGKVIHQNLWPVCFSSLPSQSQPRQVRLGVRFELPWYCGAFRASQPSLIRLITSLLGRIGFPHIQIKSTSKTRCRHDWTLFRGFVQLNQLHIAHLENFTTQHHLVFSKVFAKTNFVRTKFSLFFLRRLGK